MYTLRTIYKETGGWQEVGIEANTMLGDAYHYINAEKSPLSFKELVTENAWGKENEIYGIVRDAKGYHYPLYLHAMNFIVTDGGATFARLN